KGGQLNAELGDQFARILQLQAQVSGLVTIGNDNNNGVSILPSMHQLQQKSLELVTKEKTLEAKASRLESMERSLSLQDHELRSKEVEICETYDELCQKKLEFTEAKEKSWEKISEISLNKFRIEQLEKEVKRKDEENTHLKVEMSDNHKKLLYELEKVCKKLDDKPDKNLWRDWIAPIVPDILIIVGYFITNKNIASMKDIEPLINKVHEKFKDIKPENQQKIFDFLSSFLNNSKGSKR
ncbi:MAG: hypothetical protein WCM76_15200, partial [Bacteroidota bacterium]